ncbi:hypothetical protein ZIOFF_067746 [Zingiber officinale]|uniref:Uncharacterized protein n=1 Tax=Zingiber officinale TaxID=94328 RepID=A0A8J5CXH3_ZINOF|nr:hypothetical protein ZIOFF_067746 [Zingiber officinale]
MESSAWISLVLWFCSRRRVAPSGGEGPEAPWRSTKATSCLFKGGTLKQLRVSLKEAEDALKRRKSLGVLGCRLLAVAILVGWRITARVCRGHQLRQQPSPAVKHQLGAFGLKQTSSLLWLQILAQLYLASATSSDNKLFSRGLAREQPDQGLPARVLHRAETSIPIRKLSQGKPLNHFLLFNTLLADLGPAFIVERIELLDLGVDQSFNVPTISSGWLAGSGWGESLDLEELSGLVPWIGLGNLNICVKLSSGLPYHLQYLRLLKQVIFSKHALVNMLVTYWSHFLDGTDEYLKSILYSTILCHSSSRNNCKGRVNIKYYIVPGYKKTGAAKSNKDRCLDDKLKKMALRVIAESLSEEEIAGLKEAIPCDPPFEIPEGPSYTCRGRRRHFYCCL